MKELLYIQERGLSELLLHENEVDRVGGDQASVTNTYDITFFNLFLSE
jgi:hypothetical protein